MDHRNKPQLFGNEPQIHQGAGAAGMEVEGFVVVEGTSPIFFSMDREGAVAFVAALNRLASPPNVKIRSLSVSGRPKGKSLSRNTRMTEYSVIPQGWVDWCRENYPDVDYHSEFDSYCNWSQSSPNGAKKDHFAAFKNWIKRSAEERAKKNPESKTMSVLRVLRDV